MWLIKMWLSWQVRRRTRWISIGGRRRGYFVHVPSGYDPERPAPVVLALHGATMTGPLMALFSGLNAKADEARFVAFYPDGTGRRFSFFWNGGNCCGAAAGDGVDDVGFIGALLDALSQAYQI